MIVIDFIDMLLEQNKDKVIDAMKEALAQDKSRSQVFDISPLGLLEVTRKRVSGGLLDAFSETCPTVRGPGTDPDLRRRLSGLSAPSTGPFIKRRKQRCTR